MVVAIQLKGFGSLAACINGLLIDFHFGIDFDCTIPKRWF